MSGYWSATSGTALVFQKEEVRDFFNRYLLETYRKDGVTDRDIDFIDCTISTNRVCWKTFIHLNHA